MKTPRVAENFNATMKTATPNERLAAKRILDGYRSEFAADHFAAGRRAALYFAAARQV